MIKGNINNINIYKDIDKSLLEGLNYIKTADFTKMKDGRYNINDYIYINIQTYETKSSADYEAHRKYTDIQYIIEGAENIGVTDILECKTTIAYDDEKDIEFLEGEDNFIPLSKGEFMILTPNDAHKPSISLDIAHPTVVRKAVVKVKNDINS